MVHLSRAGDLGGKEGAARQGAGGGGVREVARKGRAQAESVAG